MNRFASHKVFENMLQLIRDVARSWTGGIGHGFGTRTADKVL